MDARTFENASGSRVTVLFLRFYAAFRLNPTVPTQLRLGSARISERQIRFLEAQANACKCLWKLLVWRSQPPFVSKWHCGCYEFWKAQMRAKLPAKSISMRGT